MTATLAGYRVQEEIYESEYSIVYRGSQGIEGQSVILKILKQPYPPPEKVAWFKREYELTRSFHREGVITVYSLITDQHRPVMVLEDFGGESLALHLKRRRRRFTVAEFLPLAIQVTDILGQVHQQHVMHKDVNPANIVWNPQTRQVKLIDFGISTVLTRENPVVRNPRMGEGTLAYMSPEQTGRMNRALDYRTDLYSLGVSFYELLTGQLPFPTVDALELMHAHIAKQPPAPHEVIPDVPQPLSAIVMNLMAKNAEDRYQSASGLKADLEACLRHWQTRGQIDPFPIRRHDVADYFSIPQKLYGREAEIGTLLAAFERVSQGAGEMMLVSGYAGIGKSALVREVYKPITRRRGYFITGKFEQLYKNIPYASLTQAFRSLIQQLLTESAAHIAALREKLLAALGSNGQVIVDLVPEVALIIGSQPSVPALPPAEAQNRLNLVLQNFIRVFTTREHPLVVFLDDLQWADAASLDLLRRSLTASDNHHLFVIGAYRDTEVLEAHPLQLTLDGIQKAGSTVSHIVLHPLVFSDVRQLLTDTFKCTPDEATPLAELVLAKTNGNPFFVNEFLKSLYTENLLTFEFSSGRWQWEMAKIQARNITDNVVELLSGKLQKLGRRTQQVVRLAACIGNQFDLRTLAIVHEHSARETAADLWEAMEEGLVSPLGSAYKLMNLDVQGLAEEVTVEYKFSHDRIQHAAYSLIPDAEKQAVHWQVGQLLLRNTPSVGREQKIFDIVNHLNLGRELFHQQVEQDELADLNLIAGRKAKAAAAYGSAFDYLGVGLSLLGADTWERRYDLSLALHNEAAESAYLCGDYVQMEQLTKVVLQQAKTLLDKVKVYEFNIEAGYAAQRRIREGVRVGLEVLELLGIQLPEKPSQAEVQRSLEETQLALAGKKIEALINLPEMTDPDKVAAVKILMRLFTPAYVGAPDLFLLIVCHVVRLSVKHGNTPLAARAYAAYGFILSTIAENIDDGYAFGQLALKLGERLNARDIQASVIYMVNGFVRFWKDHVRDTLGPSLDAYRIALETGNVEYAAVSAFSYNFKAYWCSERLAELEASISRYRDITDQLKQETVSNLLALHHQIVLNLIGPVEDPQRLVGESYDEEAMLPLLLEANNRNALSLLYINKLVLCYLFQDFSQAIEYADKAEAYLRGVQGTVIFPVHFLYGSLARLAIFHSTPISEQERILTQVAFSQEKMKNWAQHAPMNYLHKFYLVEAEHARVLGRESEAREYYDQAIDLAREHGYVNEEALANELAAKFYLARGQERIAQHYLHDAHYAYTRWGALAKVKDLETRYPQFLPHSSPSFSQSGGVMFTASTEQRLSNAFDFTSILHASQAISSEIHLDKLLTKLMALMIENAGAQRGVLILEKDGRLVIEAEKAIDRSEVQTLHSVPVETQNDLPLAILRYVERMKEQVVLTDATKEARFATDPYISAVQPKSILCTPLVAQGKLTGLLYLENNLTTGAFTPDRLEVLHLLGAEAAIAIENARLYGSLEETNAQLADYSKTLEQKVEERTRALEEKNWQLEMANQQVMEVTRRKSQFLAGMSHQLRTPMNAIIGFTRLVLRRTGDVLPERQRDNLVKVKESADHLLNLINDLLDLSKIEAGRMEVRPIDFAVERFIQTCCDTVAPLVKPRVQLRHEVSDEVRQAYTDEDGLRQIVLNLLSNAIKFTEAGEVVVRTRQVERAPGEAQLVIAVADTGVGIAAEAFEDIFDEFKQLPRDAQGRQGTGLGLPIAKRWAELLGGSIAVESDLGKGSTFTVTVPVVYHKQQSLSAESGNP